MTFTKNLGKPDPKQFPNAFADYDFDLNFVLSIEVLEEMLWFGDATNSRSAGFLQLRLNSNNLTTAKPAWKAQWPEFIKNLTTTASGYCWMDPSKVKSWFQSILKKSEQYRIHYKGITVSVATAGPAIKLLIWLNQDYLDNCRPFQVDIVPVFEFKCRNLSKFTPIWEVLKQNQWTEDSFFLVPKSLHSTEVDDADKFWRLDFHKMEAKILKGFPKMIIKFLKVLKINNATMNGISSYALKTSVFWMDIDNPDITWNEANMVQLFLEALKVLNDHLKKSHIPYFFHPQCDLLWGMNYQRRNEISTWLERTIKKMKDSADSSNVREIWRKCFGFK